MPIALPPAANYCFFDGANEPKAKTENGGRDLPSAAYVLTAPRRCTRFRDEFGKTFAEKILFCFCKFLRDGRSFSPPAPVYIIPYFSRFEVSNILYIV